MFLKGFLLNYLYIIGNVVMPHCLPNKRQYEEKGTARYGEILFTDD